MKACSVIVAAYKAERWIEQMLESYRSQVLLSSWQYDLAVGVDGCESTSRELRRLGQPHWFSAENVGVYVMRNSLMAAFPSDAYAVFDADDVMWPKYLSSLLPELAQGIIGAARVTINEDGRVLNGKAPFMRGVCVISADALAALGGYREDRIACDSDLVLRARDLKIRTVSWREILYARRRHPESLTQLPETGYRSAARREVVARHGVLRKAGELFVKPKTVSLEWRS